MALENWILALQRLSAVFKVWWNFYRITSNNPHFVNGLRLKKKLFVRSPYFVKFDVNITNIFFFTVAIVANNKFGETEESKTLKSKIGAWLRNLADREGGRKDRGISVDQE